MNRSSISYNKFYFCINKIVILTVDGPVSQYNICFALLGRQQHILSSIGMIKSGSTSPGLLAPAKVNLLIREYVITLNIRPLSSSRLWRGDILFCPFYSTESFLGHFFVNLR